MWFSEEDQEASDGYVDMVSDGIYVFTVLAGIAAIAVIVWVLT